MNLDTGEPINNLAGFKTYLLGNEIEDMHTETRKLIRNLGTQYKKFSNTRRINDDEKRYYNIPEEERQKLKEHMNDVIDAIERKNRWSQIYEIVTVGLVLVVVVIGVLIYLIQSLGSFLII